MIKLAMAAAVATTLLVGCTEEQKDTAFDLACAGVSTADLGFQIYANSARVSQDVRDSESLAVSAAQAVCDGPRPADPKTALAAVRRALNAIAAATAKARIQAGA